MKRSFDLLVVAALFGTASAGYAQTPSYPSKPIRFLVGFPPAGTNDIVARAVAQKVSENVGQSIVVENRGGANTAIATELGARAAPEDGAGPDDSRAPRGSRTVCSRRLCAWARARETPPGCSRSPGGRRTGASRPRCAAAARPRATTPPARSARRPACPPRAAPRGPDSHVHNHRPSPSPRRGGPCGPPRAAGSAFRAGSARRARNRAPQAPLRQRVPGSNSRDVEGPYKNKKMWGASPHSASDRAWPAAKGMYACGWGESS